MPKAPVVMKVEDAKLLARYAKIAADERSFSLRNGDYPNMSEEEARHIEEEAAQVRRMVEAIDKME